MGTYALQPGEAKRLRVAFEGSTLAVWLDGAVIDAAPTPESPSQVRTFVLPDGSRIAVERKGLFLHVSRDGRPLPGSWGDPARVASSTRNAVLLVGGLNVYHALGAMSDGRLPTDSVGIWATLSLGVMLIGLGFLVGRRSVPALGVAATLHMLHTAFVAYVTLLAPTGGLLVVLAVRVWFLAQMIIGFRALSITSSR